jgi:hypothetical protein
MYERLRTHPKVESDGPLLFVMVGFTVLVVVTKWLFPLSGWTAIAVFGS